MVVGIAGGVFGLLALALAVLLVVTNVFRTASPSPSETPALAQPGSPSTTETSAGSGHTPSDPARMPMSPTEIDKVFRTYMDGLTGHNMDVFKSATCPRLRSTLLGFVLNGYYIGRWTMLPYEVPTDAERLVVKAKMTQLNTSTGNPAGEVTYSWFVERDAAGSYWVCGWLGQK
ncbi:hypothetical protein GCM10027290_00170 [Micromonospora sonneratiae]